MVSDTESPLLRLPNELLLTVIDNIDDFKTLTAFRQTCRRFEAVARLQFSRRGFTERIISFDPDTIMELVHMSRVNWIAETIEEIVMVLGFCQSGHYKLRSYGGRESFLLALITKDRMSHRLSACLRRLPNLKSFTLTTEMPKYGWRYLRPTRSFEDNEEITVRGKPLQSCKSCHSLKVLFPRALRSVMRALNSSGRYKQLERFTASTVGVIGGMDDRSVDTKPLLNIRLEAVNTLTLGFHLDRSIWNKPEYFGYECLLTWTDTYSKFINMFPNVEELTLVDPADNGSNDDGNRKQFELITKLTPFPFPKLRRIRLGARNWRTESLFRLLLRRENTLEYIGLDYHWHGNEIKVFKAALDHHIPRMVWLGYRSTFVERSHYNFPRLILAPQGASTDRNQDEASIKAEVKDLMDFFLDRKHWPEYVRTQRIDLEAEHKEHRFEFKDEPAPAEVARYYESST